MLTAVTCANAAASTAMGVIPVIGGTGRPSVLKRVQVVNLDGTARTVGLTVTPEGGASTTRLTVAVTATTGRVDVDLGQGIPYRTPMTVTASGAITNAADLTLYAYVDTVAGGT